MNRKALILILILSSLSCSKKADPVVAAQVCAVTKITAGTGNYQEVRAYEYDANFRLTRATYTTLTNGNSNGSLIYNYTYNGDQLSGVSDNTKGISTTLTNANGKVTHVSGAGVASIADFTYDAQGRFATYLNTIPPNPGVTRFTAAFDAAGNLSSYKYESLVNGVAQQSDANGFTSFDSKKNPYSLLAKSMNLPYYFDGYWGYPDKTYFSTNNFLSYTQSTSPMNFTYEYNDQDYPTKVTNQYGAVTTFEYQLCK